MRGWTIPNIPLGPSFASRLALLGLPRFSTPIPAGAKWNRDGLELRIGGANVKIVPDTATDAAHVQGLTEPNPKWTTPGFHFLNGRVTRVIPATISFTIRTSYGPGIHPDDDASAYGRGTTPDDIAAGNTSLRFHEGAHGEHFLQYLRDHPLPTFTGRVGMTVEAFTAARETYEQALTAYAEQMKADSRAKVDCVGTPMSTCPAAPSPSPAPTSSPTNGSGR